MQLLHNRLLVGILRREPFIKGLRVAEDIREQEVEQGPELVKVVLQWCPGNEQSITRVEDADDLRERRFFVLDSVRLRSLSARYSRTIRCCPKMKG